MKNNKWNAKQILIILLFVFAHALPLPMFSYSYELPSRISLPRFEKTPVYIPHSTIKGQ